MGLLDRARAFSQYDSNQEEEQQPLSLLERARRANSIGADASSGERSGLQRAEQALGKATGYTHAAASPPLSSTVRGVADAIGNVADVVAPQAAGGYAALLQSWDQAKQAAPVQAVLNSDTAKGADRAAGIGFGWIMDHLSRGQYAGAKALDVIATERARNENAPALKRAVGTLATTVSALRQGIAEGLVPEDRLSVSDVFSKVNPEFAASHPIATSILGFVGDVAVDPTTYLSFGEAGAIRHLTTDGVIGLNRAAVKKAAIEAGVRVPLIERLGQLVGKKAPSAERALARESEVAVGRFFEAQTAEIEKGFTREAKTLELKMGKARSAWEQAKKTQPGALVDDQTFAAHLQALEEAKQQKLASVQGPRPAGIIGGEPKPAPADLLDPKAFAEHMEFLNADKQRRLAGVDATAAHKIELEHREAVKWLEGERNAQQMWRARAGYSGPPAGVMRPVEPLPNPRIVAIEEEHAAALRRLHGDRQMQVRRWELDQAERNSLFPFQGPEPPDFSTDFNPSAFMEELNTLRNRADEKLARLGATRDALKGRVFESGEQLVDALGGMMGHETARTVVWESAEDKLSRMMRDPQMLEKLRDKGGVKVLGQTVVDGATFKRAADLTGVTRIFDKVAEIKKTLPLWMRSRDAPIGELTQQVQLADGTAGPVGKLYLQARRAYNAIFDAAPHKAFREFVEHWKSLPKESSEKLGKLMWDMDDVASGRGVGQGLRGVERTDAVERMVTDAKLTKEEHASLAFYRQRMKEIGEYEQRLGILDHLHKEYFHRVLKPESRAKLDVEAEGILRTLGWDEGKIPGGEMTAAKERVIVSRAQAEKLGLEYSYDAALSYTMRVRDHEQAVARKIFENRLKEIFPDAVVSADGVITKGIPNAIKNDLRFMGEGVYPRDMIGVDTALRAYDGVTNFFKKAATSLRPAFAMRQSVSNTIALALHQGMAAVDPRSMWEAANVLAFRHSADGGEKLAQFSLRNALGVKIPGVQLLEEMEKQGVLRGVSIDGLGSRRFTARLEQTLDRERTIAGFAGNNKAAAGFLRMVRGSWKYTDLPAVIEDFSRATGYINARRMGHAPEAAAELVNKALFDYSHGLSVFERRYIKRVVPFYSYTRFAVPMMAKVFGSTPGRVTNLAKATNTFMEVWEKAHTTDKLSDEERNVRPGWLMEQPASFIGFQREMKAAFNTFNSFSPLDVLSFAAPQSDENDTRGAVVKFGLAQIAPWFKMPIEHMMGADAFTGRKGLNKPTLKQLAGKEGEMKWNMGPIDPEKFSANVAAALIGGGTGNAGLGILVQKATAGLMAGTPDFNKALLSSLLGYEEGVNKVTGERTVYMSPWRVHTMTAVAPGLSEIFKLSRDDKTPLQKTMQTLFGVGTVELDLRQEAERRRQEKEGSADVNPPPAHTRTGLEYRVRWAEERKLHDTAAKYRQELDAFLAQQAEEMNSENIRGAEQ